MARNYERKTLPDGSPNPLWKPRPDHWKRTRNTVSHGKRKSIFDFGRFVAIDGEGADYDGKHVYALLSSSRGESIFSESGLTTDQCLDFLWRQNAAVKNTVFCIFGGSYDANMWLRSVSRETLAEINEAEGKYWTRVGDWLVRYVPRKMFALKPVSGWTKEKGMTIWDVQGFFQGSFVSACKSWIPDFDRLDLIIEGKRARTAFHGSDIDFMRAYNDAENDALVQIMQKFRSGLTECGLKLSRWDGAGAVAMAMYKKHDVRSHYADLPEPVQEAAQHAYFGGRIEIGKVGRYQNTVYHYDINSAYPSVQCTLPSLAGGRWRRVKNFEPGQKWAVYLVRWDNIVNTPFCPFPYRSQRQRKVLFPSAGLNWIWYPELSAAFAEFENHPYWEIEILDGWIFEPADNAKPFGWISEYYQRRQRIVAESKRTGIPNGEEKILKLGLNSLYGKTAQRIGYDEKTGRKPPYHNLFYAGYITSATRAKLWAAAMQQPDAIIALATDGIYSQVPLALDCPSEKILGAWEAQEHDEMTLVQAGFYFYRNGAEWVSYSRGFDKMRETSDIIDCHDKILAAWKKHKTEVFLPCTRFITMKTALKTNEWFERWCLWHKTIDESGEEGRKLRIMPHGTKRTLSDRRSRPDLYMLATIPTENYTPDEISLKHALPWDDDNPDDDNTLIDEVEIERGID